MALFVQIFFGAAILAAIIVGFVLWIMGIIQIFQRVDLKNNKWMWLVLFIFTGSIGSIVYFFVEGKKKLGVIDLIATLAPVLLIPLYAIFTFVTINLAR